MTRHLFWLLACLLSTYPTLAQLDRIAYRNLRQQARFELTDQYLTTHWLDFYDPTQTTVTADLALMQAGATDPKTACLLRFFSFRNQTFDQLKRRETAKAALDSMRSVLKFAQQNDLRPEEGISWLLLSLVTREHVGNTDERTRRLQIYEGVVRGLSILESLPVTALDDYHGGTYFLDHHLMYLGIYLFRIEEYALALRMFTLGHKMGHPSFSPKNPHFPNYDHFEWNFLNDMALCYQHTDRLDEAAVYFRKAYEFGKYHRVPVQEAVSYGNMGVVLARQGKPAAALPYLQRAAAETRRLGDNESEFNALTPLAETYLTLRQYDRALPVLQRATVLHDSLRLTQYMPPTDSTLLIPLFSGLGKVYQIRGELRKALFFSQLANRLSEEQTRTNDARRYRMKQEKVEAEAYIARVNRLEADQSSAVWRRNALLIGLATLLVATLTYLIYVRRRRHEAERQLTLFAETARQRIDQLAQTETHRSGGPPPPRPPECTDQQVAQLVGHAILTDDDWDRFRTLFDQVYPNYRGRLRQAYPALTPAETRLICLSRLSLSTKELAHMLGVSVDAIIKTRYRIRKKARLAEGADLAESFKAV